MKKDVKKVTLRNNYHAEYGVISLKPFTKAALYHGYITDPNPPNAVYQVRESKDVNGKWVEELVPPQHFEIFRMFRDAVDRAEQAEKIA